MFDDSSPVAKVPQRCAGARDDRRCSTPFLVAEHSQVMDDIVLSQTKMTAGHRVGEKWWFVYTDGLYYSPDGGKNMTKVPDA